jgi:hypothetical protein
MTAENKEVIYVTRDYMQAIAKNCKKAVRMNDPKIMLAVLINIGSTIDSFIEAVNGIDWSEYE